jgi:hypothetical protein
MPPKPMATKELRRGRCQRLAVVKARLAKVEARPMEAQGAAALLSHVSRRLAVKPRLPAAELAPLPWPTAKQLAVAFHERITLELRKRFAGFVGAARPHSDQGGRTNVPEMVDQPCVVLEVILQRGPRASSRFGRIVHRVFPQLRPALDAHAKLTEICRR